MLRRVLFAAALAVVAGTANAQELTVYTALEADQIKAYQASFQKAYPSIKIKWVRDSTGIVTAKLLAEKAAPKADVVFGLAATSLMSLDKEGLLQAYVPVGLDKIKIDSSFVRDAVARPDCAAVIGAVAAVAKRLGVTTVAEGVETQEHLDRVRAEGCTEVQGYLYSRPMPSERDVPIVAALNQARQASSAA